jgi:hypothetical protein
VGELGEKRRGPRRLIDAELVDRGGQEGEEGGPLRRRQQRHDGLQLLGREHG